MSQTASPALRLKVHVSTFALQPLLRRMVLKAFATAKQTKDGKPTDLAFEAYEWIMAVTDWTLRGRIPPPTEVRSEFYGTFEWACHWLGEDPDSVRQHGLPWTANLNSHVTLPTEIHGRTGGVDLIMQSWSHARKNGKNGASR